MTKHMCNGTEKRIVQVDEFAQHLKDLAKRIHGVNIQKMVRNS